MTTETQAAIRAKRNVYRRENANLKIGAVFSLFIHTGKKVYAAYELQSGQSMEVSAPEYRFPYYRNHGFLVQEYSAMIINRE